VDAEVPRTASKREDPPIKSLCIVNRRADLTVKRGSPLAHLPQELGCTKNAPTRRRDLPRQQHEFSPRSAIWNASESPVKTLDKFDVALWRPVSNARLSAPEFPRTGRSARWWGHWSSSGAASAMRAWLTEISSACLLSVYRNGPVGPVSPARTACSSKKWTMTEPCTCGACEGASGVRSGCAGGDKRA